MSKQKQRPHGDLVAAVVRQWSDEEGWGVLDSPQTPGGCWAHFSALRGHGYRSLTAGQRVWVGVEAAVDQDGFVWRATEVQLSDDPAKSQIEDPPSPNHGAYRSTLSLTFADGTVLTGDDALAHLNRGPYPS